MDQTKTKEDSKAEGFRKMHDLGNFWVVGQLTLLNLPRSDHKIIIANKLTRISSLKIVEG